MKYWIAEEENIDLLNHHGFWYNVVNGSSYNSLIVLAQFCFKNERKYKNEKKNIIFAYHVDLEVKEDIFQLLYPKEEIKRYSENVKETTYPIYDHDK